MTGLFTSQALCLPLHQYWGQAKGMWATFPIEGEVEDKADFPVEQFLTHPDCLLSSSLVAPSIKRLWIMATRGQTCLKSHQNYKKRYPIRYPILPRHFWVWMIITTYGCTNPFQITFHFILATASSTSALYHFHFTEILKKEWNRYLWFHYNIFLDCKVLLELWKTRIPQDKFVLWDKQPKAGSIDA